MSQFEYVTVLVSIVIGFALSEILSIWGGLIRNRERLRPYWLYVGWTILTFLGLVQIWWGIWQLREVEFASFGRLVLLLSSPLTISLAVFVLHPPLARTGPIDLRDHYFSSCHWFFPLLALTLIELTANDALAGQPILHIENVIRGVGVIAAVALAGIRRETFHTLAFIGLFVLFVLFVGLAYQVPNGP
jgi:hypothetical protein